MTRLGARMFHPPPDHDVTVSEAKCSDGKFELGEDSREAVHRGERRLQLMDEYTPLPLVVHAALNDAGCENLESFPDVRTALATTEAALERRDCCAFTSIERLGQPRRKWVCEACEEMSMPISRLAPIASA